MSLAVLFDLDGTLTDSRLGVLRCFRHAFARFAESGGPEIALPADDTDLTWIVGPPLRDSFAKLAGDAAKDALIGFYRERYVTLGASENAIYPGVVAALDRLAQAGARLFVATSKNEADAKTILAHFKIAGRFESINGAQPDGGRSSKRDLISDTIAAHGLDREHVVMIGDREFDMAGAKEVGVAGVGALWGYGTRQELESAGAEALAATPPEAAEIALTR